MRRISGGGTVYHDLGNVNYTYIVRAGALDYDAVLSPVIAALNAIGVPARKNRTCDIAIGDLKISGSAQRMTKGRLLHHGTLLFSSDLGVLDQITTHRKNDCFQSRGTQSAICTVTNIQEHLASPMTIEEFRNRLLEQMVPPGSPRLTLTAEQEAEVCRLRDEKYRSWEWTWGKTPAFTYEKSGVFHGAPIRVAYQAKRGIVSSAVIDCAAIDGALAAQLLNGARLDPEGLCRHLPPTGRRWGGGIDGLAHVKLLSNTFENRIAGYGRKGDSTMEKKIDMPKLAPEMESGVLCALAEGGGRRRRRRRAALRNRDRIRWSIRSRPPRPAC